MAAITKEKEASYSVKNKMVLGEGKQKQKQKTTATATKHNLLASYLSQTIPRVDSVDFSNVIFSSKDCEQASVGVVELKKA